MSEIEVVVIGGGIAGVSAAYALATHPGAPSVTLLEAEPQLAHHTTGRSAAQYIENYGTVPTRALTRASLEFFTSPPDGLTDGPLLTPRGLLTVATPGQSDHFDQVLSEGQALSPDIVEITVNEAAAAFPYLRPDQVTRVMVEPDSSDIDVAGLHQAFVRGASRAGATITPCQRVVGLQPAGAGWEVTTDAGTTLGADLVVNAAGAWADQVAARAGVTPIGLRPLRRTAFMVPAPAPEHGVEPLVADVDHSWYTKRDGSQFLCSPADETPSEPCDAKPEELDIAAAIDRINAVTTLGIRTVRSAWAGLRTFSPDDTMVLGPDPDHPTFIWCAGQGGTGIQTAPATGALVADLALDQAPGPRFQAAGLDAAPFGPARFHPHPA